MAWHLVDPGGYRRFDWKCNNENAPSPRAAQRFGFEFEGVFRQAMVVKGRNRGTARFSMLDHEWPRLRAGFEAWLTSENFDAEGQQRTSLGACERKSSKGAALSGTWSRQEREAGAPRRRWRMKIAPVAKAAIKNGDRTFKLHSGKISEYGRYVKYLGGAP